MNENLIITIISVLIFIFSFILFCLSDINRNNSRIFNLTDAFNRNKFSFNQKKIYNIKIEEKKQKKDLVTRYQEYIGDLLYKAGFRTPNIFRDFLIFKIFLGFFVGLVVQTSYYEDFSPLFFVIIFTLFFEILTPEYLKYKIKRRLEVIYKSIPNLLDIFIICADAGFTIKKMIQVASKELEISDPEIADEMVITTMEIEVIADYKLALNNLYKRVPIDEIKTIVSTLSQSIEFGSSLSEHLRIIADDLEKKQMLTFEEKAGKIPSIMVIPMILFIFPSLFVTILGPIFFNAIEKYFQ